MMNGNGINLINSPNCYIIHFTSARKLTALSMKSFLNCDPGGLLNNAYLNVVVIVLSSICHSMFDTWRLNVIVAGMWYIMSRLIVKRCQYTLYSRDKPSIKYLLFTILHTIAYCLSLLFWRTLPQLILPSLGRASRCSYFISQIVFIICYFHDKLFLYITISAHFHYLL